MVRLERGGLQERPVPLASQVDLGEWALPDQWERRASRERKAPSGLLVRMGSRGPWVYLGLLALLGLQERTETRARQEDQARRAAKETKENQAPPDPQGARARSAILGYQGWTEKQGLVGSRE